MKRVFLLLGTNLGDRFSNLARAEEILKAEAGPIEKVSSVYETAAWGVTDQPSFLNQVICLRTKLSAEDLLELVLDIEKRIGRIRLKRWGERLIDIDILYYGDAMIKADNLTIPHPELHNRRFTLFPLMEIAPDHIHPVLQINTKELLKICPDKLEVEKLSPETA